MRPNVTKGDRRIGRTIRKIGASVELSSKESLAKEDEKKYRQKVQQQTETEDSPIQNLRQSAYRNRETSET
jgi:hypothetical protein